MILCKIINTVRNKIFINSSNSIKRNCYQAIASLFGYALHFPRFMDYRLDKGADEATTDTEIKRLYDDQFVK